jgi:predicted acetyltransferase
LAISRSGKPFATPKAAPPRACCVTIKTQAPSLAIPSVLEVFLPNAARALPQLTVGRLMTLASTPEVSLELAAERDAPLLANLLELYIHDMSEAFPAVELGPEGRFGYPKLPLYWSEPALRFPFLVRRGGKLAGFILVTRGSPASADPDVLDIAEFFVLRNQRRAGVGRRAAHLLWDRLPGSWLVRVSEANAGALPFWSQAITEYTRGATTQTQRAGTANGWRVFHFESPAR